MTLDLLLRLAIVTVVTCGVLGLLLWVAVRFFDALKL